MRRTWIKITHLILLIIVVCTAAPFGIVSAQEAEPAGPVYIVQPGDNLWDISTRFGVSMDALAVENGITDPNQLTIGMRLVIPGLEGLDGVLTTQEIPFGESLESLSRRYGISEDQLIRLNKFTSPDEAAAGASLIIPTADNGGSDEVVPLQGERATLGVGQSVLELAILQDTMPWTLLAKNELNRSWQVIPGDTLHLDGTDGGPGALPANIQSAGIDNLPLVQGQTASIKVIPSNTMAVQGYLAEYPLNFFQDTDGTWVALQGMYALKEPGYYPLILQGELSDGTPFSFSQFVYMRDGNYTYDPPLVVNSETVDVENTTPEDLQWAEVVEAATPEKFWQGQFQAPVPAYLSDCYPSLFGNRRSYNGSAYNFFHTGLDFCGQDGVEIYAPEAGVVVLTEALVVRGNATVIDHGWGVYTAYGHQTEILVNVGEQVAKGQVIGLIGSTGRVTGPHLHWEVIAGGVQVDPLQWLQREFP